MHRAACSGFPDTERQKHLRNASNTFSMAWKSASEYMDISSVAKELVISVFSLELLEQCTCWLLAFGF